MSPYPNVNGATKLCNGSNGVHGNGLRVLIVGAGIGGLTAAIALRQQGHEVLVGESFLQH